MSPRPLAAIVTALVCALGAHPAAAVDRTLGAEIAKPATSGAPWSERAKRRLAHDIDSLLAGATTLRGAHVGLLAIDTRSGEQLYSRNADDAFTPASTMKLLTGSVALATLGPAYRFHTEAYVDSRSGTLRIRAGGDPLLRSADVAAMARAAFATGAFRYPYGALVDTSAFENGPYPPGWSWDDFPYDYAAQLSAAPVDENSVDVTVWPGRTVGAPLDVHEARASSRASRARQVPCLGRGLMSSQVRSAGSTSPAGTPAALDLARTPDGTCTTVIGSLPLGGEPQTIGVALSEPITSLLELTSADLPEPSGDRGSSDRSSAYPSGDVTDDGLYRSHPVPPDARLVWSHDGEPLADLVADMWWPSDNFIAEMLLRAIGLQHNGMPGTTAHGVDAERAWLTSIAINPATLTIADGSGLSTYDRVTPRALVAILQADWTGPYRDLVLDDLPLAGVRGTLEHSFAGTTAERRTFAKTGSVSHARGLAGYLATLHHGAVTFAWSLDDWMGENDDLAALRARVLSRIIGDE